MKLTALLLKAGLASAGAGIYLYFKKLSKSNKKAKKVPAKNITKNKPVKKRTTKPRLKRSAAIES